MYAYPVYIERYKVLVTPKTNIIKNFLQMVLKNSTFITATLVKLLLKSYRDLTVLNHSPYE